MRYKNNIGPQVRRRRYALGWSQSASSPRNCKSPDSTPVAAASRKSRPASPMWMTRHLLYLAEVLKVPVQELFPARTGGNRLHEFMEKLETTRF